MRTMEILASEKRKKLIVQLEGYIRQSHTHSATLTQNCNGDRSRCCYPSRRNPQEEPYSGFQYQETSFLLRQSRQGIYHTSSSFFKTLSFFSLFAKLQIQTFIIIIFFFFCKYLLFHKIISFFLLILLVIYNGNIDII